MPRVTIQQPGCPFELEVGWGNGQDHVSVGSVCRDTTSDETGLSRVLEYLNPLLAKAGMPQVDHAELAKKLDYAVPEFGGWHVGYRERRRVNELIQTLQRARDGAFGKDA